MNPRWFLRMKRLSQNPPSWGRVKLFAGVVAACFILLAIERWVGWPDVLTLANPPRGR